MLLLNVLKKKQHLDSGVKRLLVNRGLLGATFEESNKIVDKEIMDFNGVQGGGLSSRIFLKKIFVFILSIGFAVLSTIEGIDMGRGFIEIKPEDIHYISHDTAVLIGRVSAKSEVLVVASVSLFVFFYFINIFLRVDYPHQVFFGGFMLSSFVMMGAVTLAPFSIGLSLGGSGLFGSILQIIIGVSLLIYIISGRRKELLKNLYGEKNTEGKDWVKITCQWIIKYSEILIVLVMANRYLFHIGNVEYNNPGILGVVYGLAIVPYFALFDSCVYMAIPTYLSVFYLAKYDNQYRLLFQATDEQWYGKHKAKKLARKRKRLLCQESGHKSANKFDFQFKLLNLIL